MSILKISAWACMGVFGSLLLSHLLLEGTSTGRTDLAHLIIADEAPATADPPPLQPRADRPMATMSPADRVRDVFSQFQPGQTPPPR